MNGSSPIPNGRNLTAEPETPSPLIEGATDAAQAPSLCTQCGLCCTGALHVRAVLDQDEIEAASAIGLPLDEHGGRPAFALPCPKLSGTACSIFGQRPRVCSRYQCQLLKDYKHGELTLEAAAAKVAIANDLLRAVRSSMPKGMSLPEARMLAAAKLEPGAQPGGRELLELQLRATALEVYLDRNFRASHDGRMTEAKDLGGE